MAEEKNLDIEETAASSEEAVEEVVSEEVVSAEFAGDETAQEPPRQKSANVKQQGDDEPHWYVVHTYSGYEEKVKKDIMKTIENRRLEDQMFEVMVPTQDVTETTKKGTKKTISKKLFPGYVLVHMIKNDVTWYVVRNTRGVTGFVGPGSEPVPLSDAEMARLGVKMSEIKIDVEIGDRIKVISGPWAGSEGGIKTINRTKQTVTMDIDLFGRSTDVEINLAEIQKLK